MTRQRVLIHSVFLFLMPMVVAWFGLGVLAAALLVLLMLLWRWLIVLSGIVSPESGPEVALETIAASHFVEKVRWSMDRLGIEYAENAHGARNCWPLLRAVRSPVWTCHCACFPSEISAWMRDEGMICFQWDQREMYTIPNHNLLLFQTRICYSPKTF